jgi:hypothetical protein
LITFLYRYEDTALLFTADMDEIKRQQKRNLIEELEKITHCISLSLSLPLSLPPLPFNVLNEEKEL